MAKPATALPNMETTVPSVMIVKSFVQSLCVFDGSSVEFMRKIISQLTKKV